MAEEKKVPALKFNDVEYNIDELSKDARDQLKNLQFVEAEIQRLQAQLAIAQTARNAYQKALVSLLPEKS